MDANLLTKIIGSLVGGAIIGAFSTIIFGSESIFPTIIGCVGALGLIILTLKTV
jgi:uncharacterized membrane protein YoaK (UPF0700 family)